MDRDRFDALAKLLAKTGSRRAALAALLGVGVGSASLEAPAQRKRKRSKQKPARKNQQRVGAERQKKRRQDRAGVQADAARCCSRNNCTPGKGKNLGKCCYHDQDLSGRNFQGANLGQANFSGARLTGANLRSANLGQTCFVDADLTGARLGGANTGTAIFCRTRTDDGEDNSGCDRGTPCCPTCDAANPCDDGRICCDGRCIAGDCCDNGQQSSCGADGLCCGNRCVEGDCCAAGDCPTETCQGKTCRGNRCAYQPVTGQPGPRCQTICCQDESEQPLCCDEGIGTCDTQGLCCSPEPVDETCGVSTPSPKCGKVANSCGQQIECGPCAEQTCQTGTCTGEDNTCQYSPVAGQTGPGCTSVCCQEGQGAPTCCDAGVTVCQRNGACGCASNADCVTGDVCCAGQCETGVCCQAQDCARQTCQTRDCVSFQCGYDPVSGTKGPGCETVCCQDAMGDPACCDAGVTTCQTSGVCGCAGDQDCAEDEVCCDQQCQAGVCCQAQDCAQVVCQTRDCVGFDCDYTPVFETDGPDCATICCRNGQGTPVCCGAGTTICQTGGLCGCAGDADCGNGEVCCDQQCQSGVCCEAQDCEPRTCQTPACDEFECDYTEVFGASGPGCQTICCQNALGQPECCASADAICHVTSSACCVPDTFAETCDVGGANPKCGPVTNNCGQTVACPDCAVKTCETGTCNAETDVCDYTPVFAAAGPDCGTLCCEDAQGAPACCAAGTAICQRDGTCGCAGDADCGDGVCCGGQCESGVCCATSDCAELVCQEPSCVGFQCDYEPVSGNVGPGCETVCCENDDGQPACCGAGVTACQADGRCACRDGGDCAAGEVCCEGECKTGVWSNQTIFGTSFGDFNRPDDVAIAADEQTVWVAEPNASRIAVWAETDGVWSLQTRFGSVGMGSEQFRLPIGVTISRDGRTAWVADTANDRVSVWTLQGEVWRNQATFGTLGGGDGQFNDPRGVAIAEDEQTVWVADTENNRVSVWSLEAGVWTNRATLGTGTPGGGDDQFNRPFGLTVAADGRTVWVADTQNHRISVWTRPDGASTVWSNQTAFGAQGSGNDQFLFPVAVAVAGDERTVWVADFFNYRVSVWAEESGAWTNQTRFGSRGNGREQFDQPNGVAVAEDGRTVWVADTANQRMSIWELICPA